MAMSKKHFEAIAERFQNQLVLAGVEYAQGEHTIDALLQINAHLYALASSMAADFGYDNPRFDAKRFLAACGF